jgi:hypothetical protein
MNESATPPYVFVRGRRCILAEVLFPKKVIYQSKIYEALELGFREEEVLEKMAHTAADIYREMSDYPQLFDPLQYERKSYPKKVIVPTEDEARERIKMFKSHFYGWTIYEADGVFLKKEKFKVDLVSGEKKPQFYDERTQILRLIFTLESTFEKQARDEGCYDVLEALMRWTLAEQMRLDHVLSWSRSEKLRFFKFHGVWPKQKRQFVNNYYEPITKEIKRWIDDINLFIFGYLVKAFWQQVIARGSEEDEIWVVSLFNVNLNIVKPTKKP